MGRPIKDADNEYLHKIRLIRKLECSVAVLEKDYDKELLQLQNKYMKKYAPYLERRRQINTGEYEPTDDDADFPLTYVDIPYTGEQGIEGLKGIPGFWMIVFNNIPKIWSLVQHHDYCVLAHLIDIRYRNNVGDGQMGFTLFFYFAPNEFFNNKVLTKQYIVNYGKKEGDPFNCYGEELVDSVGCAIDWKSRDITLSVEKKKIIKRASFFNFFDPPMDVGDPNLKPYILSYLMTDFEIGKYIKDRVIPHAILYYTGESVLREHFGMGNDLSPELEDVIGYEDWPTGYDENKRSAHINSELQRRERREQWEKSEQLLSNKLRNTYQIDDNLKSSVATIDSLAAKNSVPGEKVKTRDLQMVTRNIKGKEVHSIQPKNTVLVRKGTKVEQVKLEDLKPKKKGSKKIETIVGNPEAKKLRDQLIGILKKQKQLEAKSKLKTKEKGENKEETKKQSRTEPKKRVNKSKG